MLETLIIEDTGLILFGAYGTISSCYNLLLQFQQLLIQLFGSFIIYIHLEESW